MHALDLEAMHTLKFLGYANIASEYATNGELHVGMQFNDREDVARAICTFVEGSIVKFEAVPTYHGTKVLLNILLFHRLFWTFSPCIRVFRHYKPVVQVDRTHLYQTYKGTQLVVVLQDGNHNILPIPVVIVDKDETIDVWYFSCKIYIDL